MIFFKKINRGFTLPEILTIVGIIALISLVTVPSFLNYQKNSKLQSESRLLATNIRYAQQLAITTQNLYAVKLFTQANSHYQIFDLNNNALIKDVSLDHETKINLVTGLTDNEIRFTATGGTIESGMIYLTNTLNNTSTLEIKPSGYVKISE